MQEPDDNELEKRIKPFQLKRYVWILVIIWTVIISTSLIWNIYQSKKEIIEVAKVQSRITFDKDILYRRWNSLHGGVYVPVKDNTKPNPYLSHLPERNITSPSGNLLTLMNPAYMTRQVNEMLDEEKGIFGHITSLNPIRPENAADPWETVALRSFERGETEISSLELIDGEEYYRLMRPMLTEKPCLKCHSGQGYKEGDIRGGISVSIPMEPLYTILNEESNRFELAHTLIWAAGIGFILLGMFRVKKSEHERRNAEQEKEKLIIKLEKTLHEVKTLRGFIPICSHCKKIRNDEGYWEQIELYISQHTEAKFSHGICKSCAKELYPDLDENEIEQ